MGTRSISRLVLLLGVALLSRAQDLTSLSFEEFMDIKVSSVNKTPQKLSRTPGAVFVITGDDIRRSGAGSLPEVLRMAPGVHVARISGTSWAVGIRGFNGLYSNKLLVMIDGRTVYNGLFSGVLWSENLIMMDDIERIEVIRGPGATMWGANAVSGVINVISKSARATDGGIAGISGGSFDPVRARVRYGKKINDMSAWRAWAQYSLTGQTQLSPGGPRVSPWPTALAGARLEVETSPNDAVMLEGQVYRNTSPVSQNVTSGGMAIIATNQSGSTNGYLMAQWEHTNRRGDVSKLQFFDNYDALNGGMFTAAVQTMDVDFHHTIHAGSRHSLILGGGGRANDISTVGSAVFSFDPAHSTYGIFNAYVQDDWTLVRDRLSVELGARVEAFSHVGSALEPTAKLMWTPTAGTGYWASFSRAVRTPAHTDFAVRVPLTVPGNPLPIELLGSQQFRPEVLDAAEVGGRFEVNRKLGFDVSLFRHWYSGLHSYQLPLNTDGSITASALSSLAESFAIPAITVNGMNGINQGGEATARYDIQPGWQVSGSYSSLFSMTSYRTGSSSLNSFFVPYYTPKHQWQIRTSRDFERAWSTDLVLRRTGDFPGHALPGYTQVDCRIAKRAGDTLEFSVSGTNLLRPYQQEFVGQFLYPAGLVRRGIEAGLHWSF